MNLGVNYLTVLKAEYTVLFEGYASPRWEPPRTSLEPLLERF